MKQNPIKTAVAAALLSLSAAASTAAVVALEVPGVAVTVDGETFVVNAERVIDQREKVVYEINNFKNAALGIEAINSFFDPDPLVNSAISVLDFGAASNFNFFWSLPIVPTVGPVTLKLTIGGSCTDGGNDGCSVTPNLASGFFADGLLDGTVRISGGSAYTNALGSPTGSFGPTDIFVNLPAGPYSTLGMDLGFLGSGGNDGIGFTLRVEVLNATVPEPGSLALAALAIGAAGLASRRRKI